MSSLTQPMDSVVEEALSNFAVLRNIFSFLNEEDLETCCHVNQFWRKVADPLVFSHFQILLGGRFYCYYGGRDTYCIGVRERVRYHRKHFTRIDDLEFLDVVRILEKALLNHKVSIDLTVYAESDDQKKYMEKFFSKFGPLVVKMDFDDQTRLPLIRFCKFLLNNLPNLRELNCTGLKFEGDSPEDGNFNSDLPQNEHKHLRKISFRNNAHRNAYCADQSFIHILKMASNLNEIRHLPIELVNALEVAGKGQLLKSLDYGGNNHVFPNPQAEYIPSFQILAQLQPKLRSFRLLSTKHRCAEHDINLLFAILKPLIFSLLESSSETLQTLRLPHTGLRDYESLPRIEALQRLLHEDDTYVGLIFPANMSLTEGFPNLREFHILNNKLNDFIKYLPENAIIPWNAPIKLLSVRTFKSQSSLNTILKLQKLFPSIEEFQFRGASKAVAEFLPALPLWINLNSLTIDFIRNHDEPLKLDCAFTGLTEDVLDQLMDSSTRGNFTDEEIQRFKDESPMSKLKDLRTLTLSFEMDLYLFGLSPLANEFGFKLLPHLKVTWEIWRVGEYFMEDVKRTLEPFLAQRDNIAIDCDGKGSKTSVFYAKKPFD